MKISPNQTMKNLYCEFRKIFNFVIFVFLQYWSLILRISPAIMKKVLILIYYINYNDSTLIR